MSENTASAKEELRTKNVKELMEVLSPKPETPMLSQESLTNNFFILQDFWPVFKFFQILGLFHYFLARKKPMKRVTFS